MNFLTQLNIKHAHLGLLWGLVLMQMLNWSLPYKLFLYVNIMLVVTYAIQRANVSSFKLPNQLWLLLIVPIGFVFLHFCVGHIEFIKQVRIILVATGMSLSMWILAKKDGEYVQKHLVNLSVLLLTAYAGVQCLAYFVAHLQYGTTKNPHYLAQYCALGIPLAIFCYGKVTSKLKLLVGAILIALGYFLLLTSSRPAWIALILSALLTMLFVRGKNIKLYVGVFIMLPLILYTFNVENFGSRFTELAQHITTEERVAIWQDDWKMQNNSNAKQWIIGHGLGSFFEDFKLYSTNHERAVKKLSIDFNSPHNHLLEILYTSGIFGLALVFLLYYLLYHQLIKRITDPVKTYRNVSILLFVLLTMNTLFTAITVPFFRSYTLNIIALITGAILFIHELKSKK